MSIRANPTAIGLFMIGGALLTVVGIAVLASATWFSRQSTFVSYFGESVNGLAIGAPVKFQGVPVGQVTHLLIQIELTDKTFQVPVQYDVDLTRLTSEAGTFVDLDDPAVLRQQIADGLRAQLQMESIVTGQLYVELAYRNDPGPAETEPRPTDYPEIPTTPSLLSAFGSQAGSLVGDVLAILFRVNEMLEAVNMEEINRSVVASAGRSSDWRNPRISESRSGRSRP
jgi:paraquat-inducible protein B